MGILSYIRSLAAARRKNVPQRDSEVYPRLFNLGAMYNNRAQVKASPPNLRFFSRTPYARAAIRAIRDPIQSLEWEIIPMEGVKTNSFIQKQIAIATTCFQHPNNDNNWRQFVGMMIEDYLVASAGVAEHQLSNDPIRPLWMWPVDAQSIQIYPAWSGDKNEPRYLQTMGYSNIGWMQGVPLLNEELVYIRANASTETPYGFSPLEIAFDTINRQLGAGEYAGNLASNAIPSSLLFVPGADDAKIKSFRLFWQNEIEGQGKMPILGANMKVESVELHAAGDDALYLEFQEYLLREIATAFGLSAMNMGIERDINRNTAEVSRDRDWDNCVVPPAELFADHFTRDVLHRRLGYYQLVFQFKGLYREDEQSQSEIYQTYYKNNAITPNEQRLKLKLPPMENQWGDLTFADTQIALAAARGTSQMTDEDLPDSDTSTDDDSQSSAASDAPAKKKKQKADLNENNENSD